MILGNFWHQKIARVVIDFFRSKSSNLEWFECWFQKLTYGAFFPLSFGCWIWISHQNWKIWPIVKFGNLPLGSSINKLVIFKISQMIRFLNFDEKFLFSVQTWVGKIPSMSIFGISTQNIPNWMILGKKIDNNPYYFLEIKVAWN